MRHLFPFFRVDRGTILLIAVDEIYVMHHHERTHGFVVGSIGVTVQAMAHLVLCHLLEPHLWIPYLVRMIWDHDHRLGLVGVAHLIHSVLLNRFNTTSNPTISRSYTATMPTVNINLIPDSKNAVLRQSADRNDYCHERSQRDLINSPHLFFYFSSFS